MARDERSPTVRGRSGAVPGPKRSQGAPVGRDQVREAVIEAAAHLFSERGVDGVSLRDIAEQANVQLALIGRYLGRREEVIDEVFRWLNTQVAEELAAKPLGQLEHGRQAPLNRWLAVMTYYEGHRAPPATDGPDPVRTLAAMFQEHYGLEPEIARRRAAQVSAISLGWRMFEDYLVRTAGLGDVDLGELRDDITAIQRLIGSAPWPTPQP